MAILKETVPEDGLYAGTWGGHNLTFYIDGVLHSVVTIRGVRTPNMSVEFMIDGGVVNEESICPRKPLPLVSNVERAAAILRRHWIDRGDPRDTGLPSISMGPAASKEVMELLEGETGDPHSDQLEAPCC